MMRDSPFYHSVRTVSRPSICSLIAGSRCSKVPTCVSQVLQCWWWLPCCHWRWLRVSTNMEVWMRHM